MELNFSEIENNIQSIQLVGILDVQGVDAIGTKFAGYSGGDNSKVLVDLAEVEFLTSIGIRLLVTTAKSVASRGGKFVLLNPNENVKGILEMTGIMDIIPVHSSLEEATADLSA